MSIFNVITKRTSTLTGSVFIQSSKGKLSFNAICSVSPIKAHVNQLVCHDCVQKRWKSRNYSTPDLKPLDFSFSEDLEKQRELDPKEIQFRYKDIPEVKELPPHIQKLLTLEYASGLEKLEHRHMESQNKITHVAGPAADYERQIVYLTVKIRNLIPYIQANRQNKKYKAYLYERIQKRKQILSNLRHVDYDRFLWLLKELRITYTITNEYTTRKQSKKAKEKMAIKQDFFDELTRKLEAVKVEVEAEKEAFIAEREKVMKEIDAAVEENLLTRDEVEQLYQMFLTNRQLKNQVKPQPRYVGWKKLNDFIIKDKERKEREKWVF